MVLADMDITSLAMQGTALTLLGYLIVRQFPQMMADLKKERENVAAEREKLLKDAAEERRQSGVERTVILGKFETSLDKIQDKQDQRNLGLITGIKEQTQALVNKLDENQEAMSKAVLTVCKGQR